MANTTKDYEIFLSYAQQDRAWVAEFIRGLHEAGMRNWFDVDAVEPGENWVEKLQDALRESETLVVFVSPTSVKNSNVLFELGAGIAGHKQIIPVLVGDVNPADIPAPLAQRQSLRAESPVEAGKRVAQLVEQRGRGNGGT